MYTEEEIGALRLAALHYELDAPDAWSILTAAELAAVCNGCGPERWSPGKRRALTAALKRYEACFAIHDLDYEIGTPRTIADKRLRANMLRVWRKDFGIWRWLSHAGRAERLAVIPTVFAAVVLGGKQAYAAGKEDANEQ